MSEFSPSQILLGDSHGWLYWYNLDCLSRKTHVMSKRIHKSAITGIDVSLYGPGGLQIITVSLDGSIRATSLANREKSSRLVADLEASDPLSAHKTFHFPWYTGLDSRSIDYRRLLHGYPRQCLLFDWGAWIANPEANLPPPRAVSMSDLIEQRRIALRADPPTGGVIEGEAVVDTSAAEALMYGREAKLPYIPVGCELIDRFARLVPESEDAGKQQYNWQQCPSFSVTDPAKSHLGWGGAVKIDDLLARPGLTCVASAFSDANRTSMHVIGNEVGEIASLDDRMERLFDQRLITRGCSPVTQLLGHHNDNIILAVSDDGLGRFINPEFNTLIKPFKRLYTRGKVGSALYMGALDGVYAIDSEGSSGSYVTLDGHGRDMPGYAQTVWSSMSEFGGRHAVDPWKPFYLREQQSLRHVLPPVLLKNDVLVPRHGLDISCVETLGILIDPLTGLIRSVLKDSDSFTATRMASLPCDQMNKDLVVTTGRTGVYGSSECLRIYCLTRGSPLEGYDASTIIHKID
eukprot:GHVH01007261.1.p1 GENE.GHVH01007261.1~~GHVH01007261.1.p1  ORF type:complete len:519 (+),score=42.46 GHVH01007261.1:1244-2800(+)